MKRGVSIRREPHESGGGDRGTTEGQFGDQFGSVWVTGHLRTWSSDSGRVPRHGCAVSQ